MSTPPCHPHRALAASTQIVPTLQRHHHVEQKNGRIWFSPAPLVPRQWSLPRPADPTWPCPRRILAVFLLIRSTDAKLHEILDLDHRAVDPNGRRLTLGEGENRAVQERLASELAAATATTRSVPDGPRFCRGPGLYPPQFYERAESTCGYHGGWAARVHPPGFRAIRTRCRRACPCRRCSGCSATPAATSTYVSFARTNWAGHRNYFLAREDQAENERAQPVLPAR